MMQAFMTDPWKVGASGEADRGLVGILAWYTEFRRATLGCGRLDTETALSQTALDTGGDRGKETLILETWTDWYRRAIRTMTEIEVGGSSRETERAIAAADAAVEKAGAARVAKLR